MAFVYACNSGNLTVISLLLATDTQLFTMDKSIRTLLHVTAWRCHLGATQRLLQAGYKVQTRAKTGETPLHLAASRGHLEGMAGLLKHGAGKKNTGRKE